MAFPVSPTNGQQSTIANIVYQYSNVTNAWTVVPGYANTISATGNISANYFFGNGSQLTGISGGGGGGNNIASGTSTIALSTLNGNGIVTIAGTANVVVWANTGQYTTGLISATGNVSGGNIIQGGTRVIKWTTVANTAPTNAVAGDFWYNSYTGIKYQYTNDGTNNTWVDQSFPTVFTTLTTNQILNGGSNGTGNIGAAGGSFNTVFAKATSAQYADLAEVYAADEKYSPGTVVVFGGEKEITISTQSHDTRVAGVVSTNPAYLMNSEADGLPIAFTGRVPCLVQGPVNKGDVLVTSSVPGAAQCIGDNYRPGCVIGKSLETITDNTIKTIEVVVGRF
jgi:hypothetical protein